MSIFSLDLVTTNLLLPFLFENLIHIYHFIQNFSKISDAFLTIMPYNLDQYALSAWMVDIPLLKRIS